MLCSHLTNSILSESFTYGRLLLMPYDLTVCCRLLPQQGPPSSALEWRRFHLQATGVVTPGRATCLHYRLPQIAAIHKLHMPLHLEINSTTFRGPIEVSVIFLQKEHNSCKQCLHYHYLTPSPLPTTVPIIQQQCCPVTGRVLIALLHVSLRVCSYFM